MDKASAIGISQEQKPSIIAPKIEHDMKYLFGAVILAYGQCSHWLDTYDPALTENEASIVASFVNDVESVTEYALQGTGLVDDWLCLVDGFKTKPGAKDLIIELCGEVYWENGLAPDCYFTDTSAMRKQRRDPHGLVGKRWFCKRHGLKTISACIKDSNRHITRLECGCDSRLGRKFGVSVAALPATASHSIDA
jgi:hypothetical protein